MSSPETNSDATTTASKPSPRSALIRGLRWLIALPVLLFARLGSLLILLLGIVIVLLAWLLGTSHGASTLLTAANEFSPIQIQAENVNGRLLGDLTLTKAILQVPAADNAPTNKPTTAEIEHIRLNWQPAALLGLKLLVHDVELRGVNVIVPPAAPAPEPQEPFELPEKIELPITIELQRVVAENIQWQLLNADPTQAPLAQKLGYLEVQQLQWDNGARLQNLTVRDFNAADIKVAATIEELQLAAAQPYTHETKLQWSVVIPEQPTLAGRGSISGDLSKILLTQQLAKPLNTELQATVAEPMGKLQWQLQSNFNGLQLQHWLPDQQTPLTGKLAASGDLSSYQADANIRSRVAITKPKQSASNQPAPAAQKSQLTESQLLATQLQLSVIGNTERAKLPKLTIRLGEAELTGQAEASWPSAENNAPITAQLLVNLRGLNPGLFSEQWQGKLASKLKANVVVEPATAKRGMRPIATVELTELGGQLRGYPVAGGLRATLNRAGVFSLDKLALRSGDASLSAKGTVNGVVLATDNSLPLERLRSNLELKLDANNLAELVPDTAGQLQLDATVSGPVLEPKVRAKLNGETLVFQANHIESLSVDANWLGGSKNSKVSLSAIKIRAADQLIDSVTLAATGNLEQQQAQLDIRSATANLGISANGTLANESWQGNVTRLDLGAIELAGWQLQAPMPLAISSTAVQLQRSCLVAQGASGDQANANDDRSICLQADIKNSKGGNFEVVIDRLQANYLGPLLPPELSINTALSGQISGVLTAENKLLATSQLKLAAGSIQQRDADESSELTRFEFEQAQLDAEIDATQASGRLSIPLAASNPGEVQAEFSYQLASQQLQAQLQGRLDNLDKVKVFTNAVSESKGKLLWDLRAQGPATQPVLTGSLAISDARVVIPEPGLVLEDINIQAQGDPSGALQLDGSLQSGGGKMSVDGQLQLLENKMTGEIKLTGKRFQALNTPDAQVWISPDLKLTIADDLYKLRGSLTIPEASITPKKLPESQGGISVSDDVVIIEDESTISPENPDGEAESTSKVDAEIKLALGDKVNFSGFGLEAKLEGSLLLIEKPGQVTRGSGELQIAEGSYTALGQDLRINNGRLIFSGGPIDQPGLDMRATRTSDDGTIAGLLVRGPVNNPEFSVYSEPSKPDDVALSYLITGRPPEAQTQADRQASSAAIAALGARGGNFLAQRLGNKLGIEDIKFEAGQSLEQSTLTIGKYLTPKLYLSYGVGVFEPSSTIRLRYTLSPKWRVETESGTEVGADIFYTIERGD